MLFGLLCAKMALHKLGEQEKGCSFPKISIWRPEPQLDVCDLNETLARLAWLCLPRPELSSRVLMRRLGWFPMEWELAYDDVFVYWHKQSCVSQTCNSEPHFRRLWQNTREFQGVRIKKRKKKFFTVRVVSTCNRLPENLWMPIPGSVQSRWSS